MENNEKEWKLLLDVSSGAILGACVGDAVGTIIERIGREPQPADVKSCWAMGGGGFLSVAPGQVTDDGEMTVSLFHALLFLGQQCTTKETSPPSPSPSPSPFPPSPLSSPHSFPPPPKYSMIAPNRVLVDEVIGEMACYYGRWVLSDPFDLGLTIGGSIGSIRVGRKNPAFLEKLLKEEKIIQEKLAKNEKVNSSSSPSSPSTPPEHLSLDYLKTFSKALAQSMQNAASYSIEGRTSQSNGSLMRATPLGVWSWRLTDIEIEYLAHQDSSLSHPLKIVQEVVTCYCLAIAHLVRAPMDGGGAMRRVEGHARERGWGGVIEWLGIARDPSIFVPFHPQGGWLKIAFIYAFRCLLYGKSYYESISAVLSGGGDSDTNACIVGGLIGSLYCSSAIPPRSLSAVLSCDTATGRPRPPFLHPNTTLSSLPLFLSTSPSTLLACVGPPSPQESLLSDHLFSASFSFSCEDFGRENEQNDDIFYAIPCFNYHLSAPGRASLELYFRELLEGGESVLDVCSSWVSHLPFGMGLSVVGIGMNKEELEANPILSGYLVWDLNKQAHLPSLPTLQQKTTLLPYPSSPSPPPSGPPSPSLFDHITLHLSIQYLTTPLQIIKDAYSLLKKGGMVHISISNPLPPSPLSPSFSSPSFSSKEIHIWKKMGEVERVKYVGDILHLGGFVRVEGFVVTRERWVGGGEGDMVWVVRGWKE